MPFEVAETVLKIAAPGVVTGVFDVSFKTIQVVAGVKIVNPVIARMLAVIPRAVV